METKHDFFSSDVSVVVVNIFLAIMRKAHTHTTTHTPASASP